MKTGIQLIAEERQEQIEKHGFDVQHDRRYNHNQLPNAAVYLLTDDDSYYPPFWSDEWKDKFDKKTYLQKLIVAGALIAAEIDRQSNETPQ